MALTLRKAERRQAKLKIGLQGPSGSGKTMSALLMAYGLVGSYDKIAVIDTENQSADLYSHLGEYLVLPLEPPFTPERYVEAIDLIMKEAPEVEVIILDSSSHEWTGKGGILEISNSMTGNSFTNWAKITPRHQKFVDKILHTPLHFIATLRTKQDYVLVEKNGKQVPEKVGLAAVQREGLEYELTLVLDLDMKHKATASKDRTGLFMGEPEFIASAQTGEQLREWAEKGSAPIAPEPEQAPELPMRQDQKEELIRLLNNPLIQRDEKLKIINVYDEYTEAKADAVIDFVVNTIAKRENGESAAA